MPNNLFSILILLINMINKKMFSQASFPPSFIQQPPKGKYLYQMDTTISLPCFAKAIPSANYEWLKNGRSIENLVVNQNDGSLKIERAIKENEGSYQCVAYNYLGRAVSHISELRMAYINSYSSMAERTIDVFFEGSAILECDRPACYPPASIQWVNVKDGVKIISFEEDYRRVLDNNGNLHITKIIEKDDGEVYSCISTNNFLRTMKRGADTRIKIKPESLSTQMSKPLITLYHSNLENIVLLNSTLILSCIFSRGSVRWFRLLDRKLEIKPNETFKTIRQGTALEISAVEKAFAGQYYCEPDEEQSTIKIKFTVIVVEKPIFVKKPVDTTVSINASHIFECEAEGEPKPTIKWTSNGQDVERYLNGNRIHIHGNKLYLNNLTTVDISVLQCNASNMYGYVYTNAYINVWNKKPILLIPPEKYIKGVQKMNVKINCDAFSMPAPRIVWRKDSYKLNLYLTNKYFVDNSGNLIIKNLNSNDAGVYECLASNIFGQTKAESTIVIREPTKIISISPNKKISMGLDVILECSAKTDRLEGENLKIEWWKKNEMIKFSKSQSAAILNSVLNLESLSTKESGFYHCNASNGIDWDFRKIELLVEGKPDPANEVQVDCVKFTDQRLALLTWIDGFHNNAEITSHIIEYRTQYDKNNWFQIIPENETIILKNKYYNKIRKHSWLQIHPYIDYKFRIRSVNRLGISEPSQMTLNECQMRMERPNLNPNDVYIYGTAPNSLSIKWKPIPYLYHNGPNLSYYITIRCLDCDYSLPQLKYQVIITSWMTNKIVLTNITTNSKLTKIEIYKRYEINIQSKNTMGFSTVLPIKYFGFSGESYPTIKPSNLIVVATTDHSVKLQWSIIYENQLSRINGFFRGYRIEWCLNGTAKELCDIKKNYQDEILIKPDPKELHYRLEQSDKEYRNRKKRDILSASSIYGQLHTCYLNGIPGMTSIKIWTRIINIQYAGPKSDEIQIQTNEGTPGQVAEFNVETVEINYVEIAWAKPVVSNGNLIGYDIMVNEKLPFTNRENPGKSHRIKDPDQLRERISDLKPETNYDLSICALTKQGRGIERHLTVKTRAESKESKLIQLKIVRLSQNNFNMSLTFTEPIQKLLDFSDSGWKFFIQFRINKRLIWEETEKQYVNWWLILTNLIPEETYLVRAVINSKTGSINTQPQIVITDVGESNAFSMLRGSGTTWFIILLILIFGLLCGVIGLFIWRRKKIMYMRGKQGSTMADTVHIHANLQNHPQDRYTSFVTYQPPVSESHQISFNKQTIENDYFDEKMPFYMLSMHSKIDEKPNSFYSSSNLPSICHHPKIDSTNSLSRSQFSQNVHRSPPSNHIPTAWTMPKSQQLIPDDIYSVSNTAVCDKVFYHPFDYKSAQTPVSTSFV